jgi:hypothetical protein
MSIVAQNSLNMTHSDDGARNAYQSTSNQISEARRAGETTGFNDDDRRRQEDDS